MIEVTQDQLDAMTKCVEFAKWARAEMEAGRLVHTPDQKPMAGLFSGLTDEQKSAALNNTENMNMGTISEPLDDDALTAAYLAGAHDAKGDGYTRAADLMHKNADALIRAAANGKHSQACDGGYGLVGTLHGEAAFYAIRDALRAMAEVTS